MASLQQRLNRLAGANSSARSSQDTQILRRSVSSRSPQELLSLWHLLIVKVQHMLRYAAQKDRTILVLSIDHKERDIDLERGRQNFLKVFQYIKEQNLQTTPQVIDFTRVIGQELVGKPLPMGLGNKRLAVNDPLTCPHPDNAMAPRGNAHTNVRGDKIQVNWWTCKLCNSRWERQPIPAHQNPDEPQDSDRLTFGKHLGKTYLEVYNTEPQYCSWAIETVQHGDHPTKELQRLVDYLLFAAPPQPPTSLQGQQTLGYPPNALQMEHLNRHCLISAPANPQQVVFPDNDWDMTEEEAASIQAAEQEHRRSGHVTIHDDYDPDL